MPPAADAAGDSWDLVLHLTLADNRALARMSGVQVDYSVGARRYRLTSDYRLSVVRTGQCTEGDTATPGTDDEQRLTDGGGSGGSR